LSASQGVDARTKCGHDDVVWAYGLCENCASWQTVAQAQIDLVAR
jgi:hypothetical protein